MVRHEQISDTFVADAVLTGQDERVCEELLTHGTDQLPLDVLHRHLSSTKTAFRLSESRQHRVSLRRSDDPLARLGK